MTVALETVTAVACKAGELVVGGCAAGSGPSTAGPVGVWDWDGEVSEVAEFEAAGGEDGEAFVGQDSRPDSVWAVVDEGEDESL